MSLKEELAVYIFQVGSTDKVDIETAEIIIKQLHLVQLDEDQSLPEPSVKVRGNYNVGYNTAKLDMLKQKFRKIKED